MYTKTSVYAVWAPFALTAALLVAVAIFKMTSGNGAAQPRLAAIPSPLSVSGAYPDQIRDYQARTAHESGGCVHLFPATGVPDQVVIVFGSKEGPGVQNKAEAAWLHLVQVRRAYLPLSQARQCSVRIERQNGTALTFLDSSSLRAALSRPGRPPSYRDTVVAKYL